MPYVQSPGSSLTATQFLYFHNSEQKVFEGFQKTTLIWQLCSPWCCRRPKSFFLWGRYLLQGIERVGRWVFSWIPWVAPVHHASLRQEDLQCQGRMSRSNIVQKNEVPSLKNVGITLKVNSITFQAFVRRIFCVLFSTQTQVFCGTYPFYQKSKWYNYFFEFCRRLFRK